MRILSAILIAISINLCTAQTQIGFEMSEGTNRVEIPFEEVNNLVVIPIIVNDFLRLNFIVDTGVGTPILTEPAFAPLLNVEVFRKITISGVGIRDSINALVASDVRFELPGGILGKNMNMLILEDNFLKLSERMGTEVHGIIGYDLFKAFIVEIDYEDHVIKLHRHNRFKARKRHKALNMDIEKNRPYMKVWINTGQDSIRLMIDSGASHAILLDPEQTGIPIPEKTLDTRLGTGLGGEIIGQLSRMENLKISEFEFKDIIASLPNSDAYGQLIKRGSRQGTLGGDILSRFDPVFDYRNERLYLAKNNRFKAPFEADMSGIELAVKGVFLDTAYVDYVREDSPADKAGIQKEDVILSINSRTLSMGTLSDLNALLKLRPGKKLRFRILRGGEKLKITLRLKRQI